MRLAILLTCVHIAAAVFAVMFGAIWRASRDPSSSQAVRRSLATELIWATIPCFMVVAAATPAVIAVASFPDGGHQFELMPVDPSDEHY
jgi:heme/copper-type cytochrome/quinol oxidase subunit 2